MKIKCIKSIILIRKCLFLYGDRTPFPPLYIWFLLRYKSSALFLLFLVENINFFLFHWLRNLLNFCLFYCTWSSPSNESCKWIFEIFWIFCRLWFRLIWGLFFFNFSRRELRFFLNFRFFNNLRLFFNFWFLFNFFWLEYDFWFFLNFWLFLNFFRLEYHFWFFLSLFRLEYNFGFLLYFFRGPHWLFLDLFGWPHRFGLLLWWLNFLLNFGWFDLCLRFWQNYRFWCLNHFFRDILLFDLFF